MTYSFSLGNSVSTSLYLRMACSGIFGTMEANKDQKHTDVCIGCSVQHHEKFSYCIELFIKAIWILPFPTFMVWRETPIPALFVPYDRTRDFYFSGHTGNTLIMTMEVFRLNLPLPIKIFAVCDVFYMMVMMIVSRAHYTIDIVGGLIFGQFSFYIGCMIVYYSDFLFSLPHLAYSKLKAKCCSQEEDNVLV